MKKNILSYMMAFGIATASLTACSDMLEENPDSYYTLDTYFTDNSKAEMAILGIYSTLTHPNHYGSREMGVGVSDDTYFGSRLNKDGQGGDMCNYVLTSTNGWVSNLWQFKYEMLDRANFAIAGISGMQEFTTSTTLQQLEAEARFLRAFAAFDLVKAWGDVPFKTQYSNNFESAFTPRIPKADIYRQIVEDLTIAKNILPWHTDADSPERAGQGAARALLMRALLQQTGYSLQTDGTFNRPDEETRQKLYEAVIDEWEAFRDDEACTHDFYTGGYEALFRSFSEGVLNGRESLFEVAFTHAQSTRNGGWWGTYIGPAVAEAKDIKPTETNKYMGRANAFFRAVPEWLDFYEETDTRRDVNICTYRYDWNKKKMQHEKSETLAKNSWYPGKWRREWMPIGYKNLNYTDVNFCPLRYADVVLMAAEAYNETGNSTEALKLINLVRNRAGATAVSTANYTNLFKAPRVYDLPFIDDADLKGKIRTILFYERGFELCYEGQRKFDLIRWGILSETLQLFGSKSVINTSSYTAYPAYQNFVKGKHELLPIPLSEIQSNGKLEGKNNNGY